jgi:SWI/SNF-related matrix-associated actin-dependent regulator of chromatin subfamily D
VLGTPSWTLRIEGQGVDPAGASEKKFSCYFRRAVIQLDPLLFPEDNVIEWDRAQDHSIESDGFEVHRAGDRDTKVKILLHVAYSPPKYKLEPALAELVRLHTDTRSRVIVKLWQYIKASCKTDEKDPSIIHLDEPLQGVFQRATLTLSELPQLLQEHLSPPDPIEIDYVVRYVVWYSRQRAFTKGGRVSGDPLKNIQSFEVQVSEAKPTDSAGPSQEIKVLDERV